MEGCQMKLGILPVSAFGSQPLYRHMLVARHFSCRPLMGLLAILALIQLPVSGGIDDKDAIVQVQKAINEVKSFDATIVVKIFDYSNNVKSPRMVGVETNRDVYATGLGRRFERISKGVPQGVGVIDWKAAKSTGLSLEAALEITTPSLTYLQYINPAPANGLFLTDILDGAKYKIIPLGEVIDYTNTSLNGFQIENPHATYNILRIWLDSNHGYMVKQMDWLIKSTNGNPELCYRLEVRGFTNVSDSVWVPQQATMNQYLDGRLWLGYSMKLEDTRSTFNTITSDELFVPKSLQQVNYENKGWKWDYPPNILASRREFDMAVRSLTDNGRSKHIKWIVIGALTLLSVVFLTAVIKHRPWKGSN